ncbi:MAG: Gfo/Idh/MocA family oxidoreductase [Planctomycetes bacterium]|nr:Gfo/Idh/MocA family oxidoreductase [Planctomycetota bacterium]
MSGIRDSGRSVPPGPSIAGRRSRAISASNRPVFRVGIAGQGRSGYKIHADWLTQATDQYRIVAVADQVPQRRQDAQEQFGARVYSDYGEMLADGGFDLFVNALPTPLHVPATLAALEAGCHVLCEKPMAPTVERFDAMVAAAGRAGRVLAPFQNNRYQPFFQRMLQVIDSGVLGRILHVRSCWGAFERRWDWQTFQVNLGGCLFNTGPHAVDQALCFFPESVTPSVFCRMGCYNELGGDANDFCALTLYAPDGPTVEVHISHYQAYRQGDMYAVNGTRGGLTGGHSRLRWKYYDGAKVPRHDIWRPWSHQREYPRETLPWQEQEWVLDESTAGKAVGYTLRSYNVGIKAVYDSLYRTLTEGAPPAVSLAEVRRQIAVLEEAHRQNPLPQTTTQWP